MRCIQSIRMQNSTDEFHHPNRTSSAHHRHPDPRRMKKMSSVDQRVLPMGHWADWEPREEFQASQNRPPQLDFLPDSCRLLSQVAYLPKTGRNDQRPVDWSRKDYNPARKTGVTTTIEI